MEWFLRKLHHVVTFRPGIEAAVNDERRNDVGQWRYGCSHLVESWAAVEHAHAVAHQLLLGIGGAELIQLLTPLVDLVAKVDFDRTYCLTAQAECAG